MAWLKTLFYNALKVTASSTRTDLPLHQMCAVISGSISGRFLNKFYLFNPAISTNCYSNTLTLEDLLAPILWAVPKKKTSHSKKRLRMTSKWLKPIHHYTFCSKCGNPKLLHILCGTCFKETMKKTAEYRRIES